MCLGFRLASIPGAPRQYWGRLKCSRGICAIPSCSLQAGLELRLKGWRGNLRSGRLEPAWGGSWRRFDVLLPQASFAALGKSPCVPCPPFAVCAMGDQHSYALGRYSEDKVTSEIPKVLKLDLQQVFFMCTAEQHHSDPKT